MGAEGRETPLMPNCATVNSPRTQGHILIVEQQPGASEAASTALRAHSFETTVFKRRAHSSGNSFSDYDLVLLEHQHSRRDACLRILEKLREVSAVPIVVISDERNSSTRIRALEIGADDFLSHPYLNRELVARVQAILRRSRLAYKNLPSPKLHIDQQTKQLTVRGRAVDLTQREFEILSVLATQPGRNFSRCEILDSVWGPEYLGDERRVDLYISRIRAKMHEPNREDLIRSVYGVGYRLET